MDFIKTKCKQRNVNHIAKYGDKKQKRRANKDESEVSPLFLFFYPHILQYDLNFFVYTLF